MCVSREQQLPVPFNVIGGLGRGGRGGGIFLGGGHEGPQSGDGASLVSGVS